MVEFYTKEHKYFVTETHLYQNGEIIAEGNLKIHLLLIDEPAWLVVDKGENYPPTFLKLANVYAVNPTDEYFEGQLIRQRQMFKVTFEAFVSRDWISCERTISAVNTIHCKQIIQRQFGKEIRTLNLQPLELIAS
jgi:hypothetical protein